MDVYKKVKQAVKDPCAGQVLEHRKWMDHQYYLYPIALDATLHSSFRSIFRNSEFQISVRLRTVRS